MYSIQAYGRMINDRPRRMAYVEALRRAIQPQSVVVEVGTGTGYFAAVACRMGAARVYAIEPADVIAVARQIAAENGLSERIRLFQNMSTQVTLPERADIVVSDLRGRLPLKALHIPSIVDARTRLLKPGGILIPQRDQIWAGLVEAPKTYAEQVELLWRTDPLGIKMEAARRVCCNSYLRGEFPPDLLISDSQCWARIDYNSITESGVRGEIQLTAQRIATAHGIAMWFETVLYEDIGFSGGVEGSETVYGRTFLPFQEPISVTPGEVISVDLRADLVGEDYVWTWNTNMPGKASFRQSTFSSTVMDPKMLRCMAADYVASLDEDGEIDRFILNQMDAVSTLKSIAAQLFAAYPHRFGSQYEALTRVGCISAKFCRTETTT